MTTRIAELADRIQENTLKIDEYMHRNDLPSPPFDENGLVDSNIYSRERQEARVTAVDSTFKLHQLLLGPALCLRPVARIAQEAAHCYCCSLLSPLIHQF